MPTSELISVIIPTYNRREMVQAAVQSVLAQTYRPLECIVVDDGSHDGTFEALSARFKDSIRLIRQENRGVSAARNAGIARAKGQHIAFLDSDDVWKPKKLEKQAAFLAEHPECLICQTTEIWIRKGRRVNPKKEHLKIEGDIFGPSLARCMITPSSVLLRRKLLDETGAFDEAFPVCEDYDLWLRVAARFPVGLVREDLLVRNGGRPDQLSAGHSLDKYRIRALDKVLASGLLSAGQATAARAELERKRAIYQKGCAKRGKQDPAPFLELFDKVGFGVNKKREVLEWTHDIACRDNRTVAQVLDDIGLREILDDPELNGPQKRDHVRRRLFAMRFPRVSRALSEIKRNLAALKLPKGVRAFPVSPLEDCELRLEIDFTSPGDLSDKLGQVKKMAQGPGFARLWRALDGRDA
jgi:hypothetical protein